MGETLAGFAVPDACREIGRDRQDATPAKCELGAQDTVAMPQKGNWPATLGAPNLNIIVRRVHQYAAAIGAKDRLVDVGRIGAQHHLGPHIVH